jgi:hypothetical protein
LLKTNVSRWLQACLLYSPNKYAHYKKNSQEQNGKWQKNYRANAINTIEQEVFDIIK